MHKVKKLVYELPSGTRIDYMPEDSEVTEEDLAIIVRMVDGETFDSIADSKGYDLR